jgi:hypothetical protein
MIELLMLGIFLALLWIGRELYLIAQLALNFVCGYENALQGRYVRLTND